MLSRKHRFIYLHIPKTGGNSVQSALAPYCDDRVVLRASAGNVVGEDGAQGMDVFNEAIGFEDPTHKHASIADYAKKLGSSLQSYFIFSSIRNPWDRVISRTAFATVGGIGDGFVLERQELFLPRPMLDYVTLNGTVALHDVIRFEHMQGDFDRICDRLGIRRSLLPHKNRSIRGDYLGHYSKDSVEFVRQSFRADIEAFGYDFGEDFAGCQSWSNEGSGLKSVRGRGVN